MDKEKYIDIINKLDDCISFYEERYIDVTKFHLQFANNDNIYIKFGRENIPHLLGININFLRSTGLFTGSPYDILCSIVSEPNRLLNQINQGHIKANNIFSDRIDEKLENFKNICGIKLFDVEFVVEYKKDRNYISSEPLDDGYYIGYSNGTKLNIVGFTKNDSNDTYYPHTSMLFEINGKESDKFLKRLFKNQESTIISLMRKNTFTSENRIDRKQFFYNDRDKISRLNKCKRYAEMYGGISNTTQNHIFFVDKVINLTDEKLCVEEILDEISAKMKQGKMIDVTQFKAKYGDVNDHILKLIGAHNDSLVCSSSDSEYSYEDLIREYEECKENLVKHDHLIKKLQDENQKLKAEKSLLTEENEKLNDEREQIKKILK